MLGWGHHRSCAALLITTFNDLIPGIFMYSAQEESSGSSLPAWLFVLAGFGVSIGYFWANGDCVTAAVVGGVAVAGFSGYRLGAAGVVGFLAGVAIAAWYAPSLGRTLEPRLADWFGMVGLANRILSVGIAGGIITILATMCLQLLAGAIVKRRPRLQACNKWLGFLLGTGEGALLTLIVLGGILAVEPMAKERLSSQLESDNDTPGRIVAERVLDVGQATRRSAIGPYAAGYNPFQRVPHLKRLYQGMIVVSRPETLRIMASSPAMEQLREKPSFQEALEMLNSDPQIQEILASGEAIDARTAMSLLGNPTILKLLDDPDFRSSLAQAVGQLDPDLERSLTDLSGK